MIIIDSHVHIFENFAGILDGVPIKAEAYGKVRVGNKIIQFLPPSFIGSNSPVETLIAYMDWCEVEKAILVPNVVYGFHNEYSDFAVNYYPDKLKAIGLINVIKVKEAINELNKLGNCKSFIGIKIDTSNGFQCFQILNLDEKIFDPIWQACNDLEFFLMLHLTRFEDIISLKNIIKKYKKIKYIICHLGSEATLTKNSLKKGHLNVLFDLILNNSNVWVDTAQVSHHYAAEEYPFIRACELIEEAYKTIGPEKILWGSDYPGALLDATYKQFTEYIIKGCKKIPENHLEMIMGLNALKLFWDKS